MNNRTAFFVVDKSNERMRLTTYLFENMGQKKGRINIQIESIDR